MLLAMITPDGSRGRGSRPPSEENTEPRGSKHCQSMPQGSNVGKSRCAGIAPKVHLDSACDPTHRVQTQVQSSATCIELYWLRRGRDGTSLSIVLSIDIGRGSRKNIVATLPGSTWLMIDSLLFGGLAGPILQWHVVRSARSRLFVSRIVAEIEICRDRNKPFATFKYAVGGDCYAAA